MYVIFEELCGEIYVGILGFNVFLFWFMFFENLIEGNGFGNGFDLEVYGENGWGCGLFNEMFYVELYVMNFFGKFI